MPFLAMPACGDGCIIETDARTEVTLMLDGIRIYYSISYPQSPQKKKKNTTQTSERSWMQPFRISNGYGFSLVLVSVSGKAN